MSRHIGVYPTVVNNTSGNFTASFLGGFGELPATKIIQRDNKESFQTGRHEVNDSHWYQFSMIISNGSSASILVWDVKAEGGDHGIKVQRINLEKSNNIDGIKVEFTREGSHDGNGCALITVTSL